MEVCVVEAVNNSIKHAYQGDPDHNVELEVNLLPHQLIVDVWDSGMSADTARMHADHRHALEIDSDLRRRYPRRRKGSGHHSGSDGFI